VSLIIVGDPEVLDPHGNPHLYPHRRGSGVPRIRGIAISYRAAVSGGTRGGAMDLATFSWFLTFPGAFDAVLSIVVAFGGIIGLFYVATISGSEWSWGTLRSRCPAASLAHSM